MKGLISRSEVISISTAIIDCIIHISFAHSLLQKMVSHNIIWQIADEGPVLFFFRYFSII